MPRVVGTVRPSWFQRTGKSRASDESPFAMCVTRSKLVSLSVFFLLFSSETFAQNPKQPSTIEVILPGYKVPVSGRWLGPSQNQSGVHLGGMGAGYLEL